MTTELKWASGEACRVGDVVRGDGNPYRVTSVGETKVLVIEQENGADSWSVAEIPLWPQYQRLIRRAGETGDRDRTKWEYAEGGLRPITDAPLGWERIVSTANWCVDRRQRQPVAPPAKPPFGGQTGCDHYDPDHPEFCDATAEQRAKQPRCNRKLAAPAKPRRMKGNPHYPDSQHAREHDEGVMCDKGDHHCEPVETAAPPLELPLPLTWQNGLPTFKSAIDGFVVMPIRTTEWHGFRHAGHDWSRLNFRGADGYSNDHYCWVGVNNELERATAIVFRRRKG